MKKTRNRLLSVLLTVCMVLTMLPTTAFADDGDRAIMLGASQIGGGQADSVYFGTYKQSSDDAGGYNTDPIKWRVLSTTPTGKQPTAGTSSYNDNAYSDLAAWNSGDGLLLVSDQNLDVFQYHTDDEAVTWERSTLRSWLNGYGASENNGGSGADYSSDNFISTAFSSDEQSAVLQTVLENADNPTSSTEGGNHTADKAFALSIAEANNTGYFTNNSARISTNTAYVAAGGKLASTNMYGVGVADFWLLRSPGAFTLNGAACVTDSGEVNNDGLIVNNTNVCVRPAFNLDLSSVLFTSAAAGGKSASGMDEVLTAVGVSATTEWKLTLLDNAEGSGRENFDVSTTSVSAAAGDSVSVTYSGAKQGTDDAPEYLSAMIVDSSGNVLYYGQLRKIALSGDKSGTESFAIPAELAAGNYTLKVFNEQYNGDYKTDYASAFEDVALTVTPEELNFAYSKLYDVPAGMASTDVTEIDVFDAVSGGTAPYTFSFEAGAPSWLSIGSSTGKITGTRPASVAAATTATVKVEDSVGAEKTIQINVGAVTAITYNIWVGGVQVTAENATDVLGAADTGATVTYNAASNTLTLNNAAITGYHAFDYSVTRYYCGIYAEGMGSDLTIALVGTNTITRSDIPSTDTENYKINYGIDVEYANLIITAAADATLDVSADAGSTGIANARGIYVEKDEYANGGALTVSGKAAVTASAQKPAENEERDAYGVCMDAALLVKDDASLEAKSNDIALEGARKENPFLGNSIEAALTQDGVLSGTGWSWNPYHVANAEGTPAQRVKVTPLAKTSISFTTQPAATTTVTAGSISGSLTAAATVTPSGTATLNWYACDASGTIDGNSLATGGSFAIPTDLTADTYYYVCEATYTGATAVKSSVATVTVQAVPTTAYDLWVGGVQVTSANAADVLGAADTGATVTYTPADGDTPAKLTLNGATIAGDGNAIAIKTTAPLDIVITGDVTLNGAIDATTPVNITGSGSLTITPQDSRPVVASPFDIELTGSITVSGCFMQNVKRMVSKEGSISATNTGATTVSCVGNESAEIRAAGDITIKNNYTNNALYGGGSNSTVTAGGTIAITNSGGPAAIGSACHLTAQKLSFTLKGKTVTLDAGEGRTVTCSGGNMGTGVLSDNVSYQWYNHTDISDTDGTVISAATGASYAPAEAGYYSCLISDGTYSGHTPTMQVSAPSDTTAPTLSAGAVTRASDTAATVKFTSDEAGTYYYDVVAAEGTPNINTDGEGTACGTTEQTISLTDLTAGAKDIYIVIKDAAGNVSSDTFKIAIPAYVAISGVSPATGLVYNGSAQTGYTGTAAAGDYTGTFDYIYEGINATAYGPSSAAPVNAGSYRLTISVPTSDKTYTGSTSVEFTIAKVATPIVIKAANAEKTYDKNPLTSGEYTYTPGVLVSGDILTATVQGSQTDAGSSDNVVTGYVVKRGEADVTDNYTFGASVNGKLTVSIAEITGKPSYTPITEAGKTLADANLTIGTLNPAGGTLEWDDGSTTLVEPNVAYTWSYTPLDPTNYQTIYHQKIIPYVTGTRLPDHTIPVPYTSAYDTAFYVDFSAIAGNLGTVIRCETEGPPTFDPAFMEEMAVGIDEFALAYKGGCTADDVGMTNAVDLYLTLETRTGTRNYALVKVIFTLTEPGGGGGGSTGGGGSGYTYYTITASAGKGGEISPNGSVSVREDRDKTFTITPDKGYVIDDVLVDGKSVGAVKSYTFEDVSRKHTIKAVFKEAEHDNPQTGVDMDFEDVAETDWFYESVAYVYDKGLMTGTSATTFAPHGTTTRAMVATVLWRMEGSPEVEGMYADYADVAQGSWYENAIGWAAKNGILSGYGGGFMGPQDAITREQMAAVLYRYAEYKDYDLTATADLSQFSDAGQISAWAVTPLSWANANGLVNGKSGGILDPRGNAERCQVAAILQRFCEAFVK